MFLAASIVLPAAGLVVWAFRAMARVEADLRSFDGFEGMHLEPGPQSTKDPEGTAWPIPG